MARAFARFHEALAEDGRLVLVFANKQPDAWETLVSALIRAGFVVDASWPIQTEMQTRQRSLVLRGAVFFHLVGLQETSRYRPRGLGRQSAQRNAGKYYPPVAGLLGRWHPRAGLRLGSNRTGAGGFQPASRGSQG